MRRGPDGPGIMKNFFFRLSLSQQFLLLSFPILLAGTLIIGHWIGKQVEESVVRRIGGVTALYVDSFVAPHVQVLLRKTTSIRPTARPCGTC